MMNISSKLSSAVGLLSAESLNFLFLTNDIRSRSLNFNFLPGKHADRFWDFNFMPGDLTAFAPVEAAQFPVLRTTTLVTSITTSVIGPRSLVFACLTSDDPKMTRDLAAMLQNMRPNTRVGPLMMAAFSSRYFNLLSMFGVQPGTILYKECDVGTEYPAPERTGLQPDDVQNSWSSTRNCDVDQCDAPDVALHLGITPIAVPAPSFDFRYR